MSPSNETENEGDPLTELIVPGPDPVAELADKYGWTYELAEENGGWTARLGVDGGSVEAWGASRPEAAQWLRGTLRRLGLTAGDPLLPRGGEIVQIPDAPGQWLVVETRLAPDEDPGPDVVVVPLPWEHRQVVPAKDVKRAP